MPRKALFLERPLLFEGDLRRPPPRIPFPPDLLEGLAAARSAGLLLFVVGTEDEVALGRVPEAAYRRTLDRVFRAAKARGVEFERAYLCFSHPRGKKPYQRDTVHRMPNVGTFLQARQDYGVVPKGSWLVARSTRAALAGSRAGCLTALVETPERPRDREYFVEPDLVVPSAAAALRALVGHELALLR